MMDVSFDRPLPTDLDSERAILGACLLDPSAIHLASDGLLPEDFYLESHRIIFRAMLALTVESAPIDHWTLKAALERDGKMEVAGGIAYLMSLTDGMPHGANVAHYGALLREKSTLRALIVLGSDLTATSYAAEEPTREILEATQGRLLKIYGREIKTRLRPMADIVDAGYLELCERRRKSLASGIQTGFCDLDGMTGGFRPGNLCLLAGRPGSGKSALATNIVEHSAVKNRKRVAVFSVEMGQTELYNRMVASMGKLSCAGLTRGYVSERDMQTVVRTGCTLADSRVWIDDSGSITIMQMRARAQRIAAEYGLDLVIVDYLQLVRGEGKSAYERVSDVSRNLKILAKDLQVPILALSQLHRLESEESEPNLNDLRESGALEQDADLVIMLWSDGGEGYRHCKVAKQRNGSIGKFNLGWIKEQTRFTDAKAGDGAGLYQDMAQDC